MANIAMNLALMLVLCALINTRQLESTRHRSDRRSIGYTAKDIANKTPIEILKLRGFRARTYFASTKDGYHINLVRIINPKMNLRQPLKRPVIFNHGLLESSTIWLINSVNVKPLDLSGCNETLVDDDNLYRNGPMMLSNHGYDVWLMSMRGTDFSLRHDSLTPFDSEFWNYSLDEFALNDVPSVIDFVRDKTRSRKVAYVGHSQATFAIFALLIKRPEYNSLVEPVVAVAPVSYFHHSTSVSRILFLATLRGTDKDLHSRFPPLARMMRDENYQICAKQRLISLACRLVQLLIGGKGKRWLPGYFSHLPFWTSLKVLRHFGQLIERKKFAQYDHGTEMNIKKYGSISPPEYPIANLTSRSIVLISTKSDAISPPEDVQLFKRELKVPLFKEIFIDDDFNHFDLITDKAATSLVFKPILEILETFELWNGVCSQEQSYDEDD